MRVTVGTVLQLALQVSLAFRCLALNIIQAAEKVILCAEVSLMR